MDKVEKLKKLLEIANEDYASKKEVVLFVKQIIDSVKQVADGLRKDVKTNSEDVENSLRSTEKSLETALRASLKELTLTVSNTKKETLDEAYKSLNREVYNIEKAIKDIPQFDSKQLEEKFFFVIKDIENKIDSIKPEVPTAENTRDSLETLKGDERLDVSAIKGIEKNNVEITADIMNRAVGIVDQRTSFLINKVSNLQATVNALPVSGSLPSTVPTGTVDGTNQVFVFTGVPSIIVRDGVMMRKTSSDGSPNWTGTNTITLTIAPTFDIFAV